MPEKTIFSICGMCSVHCPVQINIQNGECRFIQGNQYVPGIKGALCVRGAAGLELNMDDERPQFPMIRKGERGEGRWLRVSWDDALDRVAEKISAIQSQHGKESLMWSDSGDCFSDLNAAFVRGLGSPNYHTSSSSFDINVHHAAQSLFGFGGDELVFDYKKARYVILQTRNLFESIDVKEVNDLLDGLEAGCKLAVIDIRATVSSAKADRFMLIRPGTDYALNLSVINLLLTQQLYNAVFAQTWISDIEALLAFVAPYTPKWAEAETGIPEEAIISLVQEIAGAAPAVIWHPGRMTARYKDSFYVSRTAFIINSLLGSIGARGGLALAAKPESVGRKGLKKLVDLLPEAGGIRADGVGSEYPLFDAKRGLLHRAFQAVWTEKPYPVKAYMSFGHDPLSEHADPAALTRILDKLELIVCASPFWSQTAWYADIVLPVSSYLEQESILIQQNGLKPGFAVRFRCLDPVFDSRPDWRIITELSKRLGITELSFDSIQDIWSYQLRETGVSMEDFEERGLVELTRKPVYEKLSAERLNTTSSKIEIINSLWEKAGIASLKPHASMPVPEKGLYRLTIGGCALHVQGHTINNRRLFPRMPENELWMHDSVAIDMGVSDGESVEISGNGYCAAIKVRISRYMHPEAVFMVHGFGRSIPAESRACGKGVSDIALMSGGLGQWDPAGGGLAFQEHFVSFKKR
ncbi:MAG: thiosulfate reductase [Desulfobacteraceae bacterium]|nr:MAG: thiosulfate reductase [Desulfobacteraceae bacterium]